MKRDADNRRGRERNRLPACRRALHSAGAEAALERSGLAHGVALGLRVPSAALKMVRARTLNQADAVTAIDAAAADMQSRDVLAPQTHVLEAARLGVSAYDAQYVALAEILQVQCITADRQLAKKCPRTAVLLADFIA